MTSRRAFLHRSAIFGALSAFRPLHALGQRVAGGEALERTRGYGPLVDKGDLWLPAKFNYQIISRQGDLMTDGNLTPGIFDGMGAFAAPSSPEGRPRTILIRNHENREFSGEQKVLTGTGLEYDELAFGGNTKLTVERRRTKERDPVSKLPLYAYEVVDQFAILGGTTANCAGGEMPVKRWITCEEAVRRSTNGKKHGYVFEVDALAPGPVQALPVLAAGRMVHEAVAWRDGALYLTEDRSLDDDPVLGRTGASFYRYLPGVFRGALAETNGVLQALKIRDEFHANMDVGRTVGKAYPVEWVTVDNPDHDDDTDNRRDRVPGFTPVRLQAQDKGAAFFDRLEGIWASGWGRQSKIYFDCTTGGAANLGQVWAYDLPSKTITLVYESTNASLLRNPDNLTIVPQTRDVFLCEDNGGPQFIRGLTRRGAIYDFARTKSNQSEFCGACFDRSGHTLYVNQQGQRGALPGGPAGAQAVTYAIYGPFGRRVG